MSETRKVQEIGKSLYISLPKNWTEQMQLKRGDLITLIPQQTGVISVYPHKKENEPKQITLEFNEEPEPSFRRRITSAYVDGFDIIQLRTKKRFTANQHDSIRKITAELFGIEVVQAASNVVTIECLLKPTLPIEKTMVRIQNIIKEMVNETVAALREHDVSLANDVPQRMLDINRLSFVIYRALRSLILYPVVLIQGKVSLIDAVDSLQVLYRMSSIADNIKNSSESISKMDVRTLPADISDLLCDTFNIIMKLLDEAIQSFLLKNIMLADQVLDVKPDFAKLWSLCLEANQNAKISTLFFSYTHRVIDSLIQIHRYILEIAEIAIDRAEADRVY